MPETVDAQKTQREITYAEAVREALRLAMRQDERVFVLGEDVGVYGGAFGVTDGLLDEFGPERVQYKPEASPIGPKLSELRDATKGRARVFEGTGGIALVDSFKRGVVGTMPGADLIRGLVPLWRALEAGDAEKADAIHGPLSALISMQTSLDGFLAVEKHLLKRQGIFKNTLVRGPVGFRLDPESVREVERQFDRMIAAAH